MTPEVRPTSPTLAALATASTIVRLLYLASFDTALRMRAAEIYRAISRTAYETSQRREPKP